MKLIKTLPYAASVLLLSTSFFSCKKDAAIKTASQQITNTDDEAVVTKSVDESGVTRLALRPCDDGQDTYVTFWNGDADWANSTGDWAQELSMDSWTIDGIQMGVRSYIRFDRIDQIPAGAEILSAKLCLYSKGSSISAPQGNSGDNTCRIERVTGGTWQESSLTWNTQPSVTSTDAAIIPASTSQWNYDVKIDVTNMVKAMAADQSKNYGFRISLVTESIYRSIIFASSENPNVKLRPKLVIQYQ